MREKPKRRGVSFQRRGVLTCLLFVSPWLVGAVYTIVAGFLDTSNEMLGYIHELGFQWSQFEYASAVSWLYFLFVILVLAALFLLLNPATKRVREG